MLNPKLQKKVPHHQVNNNIQNTLSARYPKKSPKTKY